MTSAEIYKFLKENQGDFFTIGEIAISLNKSYESVRNGIFCLSLSGFTETAYYKKTIFVVLKRKYRDFLFEDL